MSIKNHRVVRDMADGSTLYIRPDAAIEAAENEGWPPRPPAASERVQPQIRWLVPRERSRERFVTCS